MSVTQVYKKRHSHCLGDCYASHLENFTAAVAGSLLIALPFALWFFEAV